MKPKGKRGRPSKGDSEVRPKRATASRVWANGEKNWKQEEKMCNFVFLDYGSSGEEEEIEEARPRVGRKKRGDDSDSGSDVSCQNFDLINCLMLNFPSVQPVRRRFGLGGRPKKIGKSDSTSAPSKRWRPWQKGSWQ